MKKKHRHHRKHDVDHHEKHHRKHPKKTIDNPILKALLCGVYDSECVLSKLRGCPHLLKEIWREVKSYCLAQITLPYKRVGMKNGEDLEDQGTVQSELFDPKVTWNSPNLYSIVWSRVSISIC